MTSVVDAELGEQQFSRRTVLKLGGAAALGSPFLIGHASGASRKSAPPVYFDRQYDVSSTNGAFPMGLAETAAGGFMIAGFRVHSSNWLVKTKPNGRWLWTRSLHHWPDGSVYPFATPRDIIPAHGSGFIAVGSSREHPQEGGKSHRGFWIQKFTDTNEHVWFRDFGHGFRVAHSVARAPDGGYVIVGSRIDSDLDENVVWLVKTDEHGHKQWTRTYHHQGSASGYKIVALPQGGYAILASVSDGTNESWVFKICPNGRKYWECFFDDEFTDLIPVFRGLLLFGANRSEHFHLVRLNRHGARLWTRHVAYPGMEHSSGTLVKVHGGYVISGSLYPGSSDPTGVVARYSLGGKQRWEYTSTPLVINEIIATRDGNVAIAGHSPNENDIDTPILIKIPSTRALSF
ncbi:hypothetical protein [Halocatena marina]|uniref:hypothetical protein n=1 Tax=Halocatena marina TaxID=2934937 RepID=UPI00222E6688|nr:hypothetical protein [Halocatena marina]